MINPLLGVVLVIVVIIIGVLIYNSFNKRSNFLNLNANDENEEYKYSFEIAKEVTDMKEQANDVLDTDFEKIDSYDGEKQKYAPLDFQSDPNRYVISEYPANKEVVNWQDSVVPILTQPVLANKVELPVSDAKHESYRKMMGENEKNLQKYTEEMTQKLKSDVDTIFA